MILARAFGLLTVLLLVAHAASAQTKLQVTSKLGTKFYSVADGKGAVADAQKNLAGDPKSPALMLKLAQAEISVWEDKQAVATLTRALAISPGDASLYLERGHRELPLREFKQARADLSRAAELNPKEMAAYYHLGLAHYFLGEFAPAAEAFQRAVETAPNTDERINSTNWLFAALSRAGKTAEAAKALEAVPPEMTNESPHTKFYLNLVRFFQGRMSESDALPPEPPADNTDQEVELPFDTVAYGIGNWHLYHGNPDKAREYFRRVLKGHVWITWGFVGAETELLRMGK
ncbi:MAG TPA: tetratricopeptide repeat protein [Bryobacteraceae bacterium]|nr:tetratricopeptide repeat protein [Bryobacteraceae bacterium]